MKIGVISNKNSRWNRKREWFKDYLLDSLGKNVLVKETSTLDEIYPALSEIFDSNVYLLIINGGDGTYHHVISAMINLFGEGSHFPEILNLRGGTINLICNNLGTKHSPTDDISILASIRDGVFSNPYLFHREVTPICFTSNLWEGRKYGFVFGNGIVFSIISEYYREGEPSLKRAFNVTTSILTASFVNKSLEAKYMNFKESKIIVDGYSLPYNKIKISVASSLPRLLLFFYPFDLKKGTQKNRFFFLVNSMATIEIARNFLSLCRGTYKGQNMFNDIVKSVKMEFEGGFTIDGEIFQSSE